MHIFLIAGQGHLGMGLKLEAIKRRLYFIHLLVGPCRFYEFVVVTFLLPGVACCFVAFRGVICWANLRRLQSVISVADH